MQLSPPPYLIVGSGPSAAGADLERVKGRAFVLALNESWRLCPWADALYGADGPWWRMRRPGACFAGRRITASEKAAKDYGLELVSVRPEHDEILIDRPGEVGHGGNSGFQAVNLAVQWGAKRIILVGFDYRAGPERHWHGRHEGGLNNPDDGQLKRWAATLDAQADRLAEIGVTLVVATPSALTAYPTKTLEAEFAENRTAD